ncbi:MAG: hypothetical protein JRI23_04555 [Deltaproteobacteria bacterium]|jgi:hypothetical protein|nr:hypothetical protein [Deltaproteobacteria bacterium]MBW2530819.1 hypothetical protein [Deltaproteobacteria bacterium]
MATKLETFLTEKKIDSRRVLAVSRHIERLRPEDRAIKLKLRLARKTEDAKRPEGLDKPRSGRPVSQTTLNKALSGKRISRLAQTRILRAVNRILEQRKSDAIGVSDLFEA